MLDGCMHEKRAFDPEPSMSSAWVVLAGVNGGGSLVFLGCSACIRGACMRRACDGQKHRKRAYHDGGKHAKTRATTHPPTHPEPTSVSLCDSPYD